METHFTGMRALLRWKWDESSKGNMKRKTAIALGRDLEITHLTILSTGTTNFANNNQYFNFGVQTLSDTNPNCVDITVL